MTAFFLKSRTVSVIAWVVAFAVQAFVGGLVSGACVRLMGAGTFATVRGFGCAVAAFVSEALTTQASYGLFFGLFGDNTSV